MVQKNAKEGKVLTDENAPMYTKRFLGPNKTVDLDGILRVSVDRRKEMTRVIGTDRYSKNESAKVGLQIWMTYKDRSKGPSLSPISLKAGQCGISSGLAPLGTYLNPVSPPNHILLPNEHFRAIIQQNRKEPNPIYH